MAKSPTRMARGAAPDTLLDQAQWIDYLARFTRENRGARARLEVLGADIGDQVETQDRLFDGIAADIKDGENAVWITFGSTLEDHVTHGIRNVTAIRVRPPAGSAGAAVLIETKDSAKTLLELGRPEESALPAASKT